MTVLASIGIIAGIMGYGQIEASWLLRSWYLYSLEHTLIFTMQSLESNPAEDEHEEEEGKFDIFLLRFLSVFIYIHHGFEFFSGVAHILSMEKKRGWLAIQSSIVGMGDVAALTIFLTELQCKVCVNRYVAEIYRFI